MTNKLTVEQCDRDAAADIWLEQNGDPGTALRMRLRHLDDSWMVQVLARHRHQAEARAEGLERALKEHHEWQMSFDLDDPEHGFNYAAEYADSGMCERALAALTVYRSARP